MDNFENVEHENQTTLKALTRNLDDLQHRVKTAEGQPMEAIHCLEHELHTVSLTFQPSAPQNPWMKYYNNTWRPYVLPKSKPLLQTL